MKEKKDPLAATLALSSIRFLLLTLITGGLYYVYIQHNLTMAAVKHADLKLSSKAIKAYGCAMTFWLLGLWLLGAGAVTQTFEVSVVGSFVFFIGTIFNFRWVYIYRRIIALYYKKQYRINYIPYRIPTYLFQAFWLVWAINRTDRRVKKHNEKK